MNAPQTAADLAQPTITMIALASLTPSSTHIQELRRARFDPKLIGELAESIKQVGILQPILARRSQANGRADRFEIVAGERRFLGAKKAGLAEIPATVRDLSDEQVLEVQLIENLQRSDLHELEEAEGYEELMKLKKISADVVGDMVGRSKGYVYARVKLLALCKEARTAFYAKEIDASTALLIARIPHHDLQRQAMKDLATEREYGDVKNFKEASAFLRDRYMLRLKEAVFDIKDEQLVPRAGSCLKCPKRTGNQTELFADVKEADICTDTKCFDDKRAAHYAISVKKIEASGKTVIYGDAAKKIMPYWKTNSGASFSGGYHPLDEYNPAVNGKLRAALPKDFEPVLVQHPGTGKIIETATAQQLTKAKLKAKHSPSSGSYDYDAAERRRMAKGPDVDTMLTERLAQLIHEKAPKSFGRQWVLDLAQIFHSRLHLKDDEAISKAWKWPARALYGRHKLPAAAEKLDERGLVLLMFDLAFATGQWEREDVLKIFGIDEQKTRELIIEERKAAARKARDDAKAQKEAKAKAKSPVAKVNAAIEKRAAKAKAKKK